MAVARVVGTTIDILCISRRSVGETPVLSRWRCHRSLVAVLGVAGPSAEYSNSWGARRCGRRPFADCLTWFSKTYHDPGRSYPPGRGVHTRRRISRTDHIIRGIADPVYPASVSLFTRLNALEHQLHVPSMAARAWYGNIHRKQRSRRRHGDRNRASLGNQSVHSAALSPRSARSAIDSVQGRLGGALCD